MTAQIIPLITPVARTHGKVVHERMCKCPKCMEKIEMIAWLLNLRDNGVRSVR